MPEALRRVLRDALVCALLAGLFCPSILSAAPLFGEPRIYPVGTSPVGIVSGEFNRMPGLDLATADEGNTLTILGNLGNGVFRQATQVPFEDRYIATAVAAGDFNADGVADLAISADDVQSFPGFNGAVVSFLSSSVFTYDQIPSTVGPLPTCVAYADLDGDSVSDLSACATDEDSGEGTISFLRGNLDGTFDEAQTIPLGDIVPGHLVVADVDDDNHPDMVLTDIGNSAFVLFGSGAAAFGTPVMLGLISEPQGLVAARFDDDFLLDIAVASRGAARVVIFRQTAPRIFSGGTSEQAGLLPVDIAAGRFDADDNEDLLVLNNGTTDVTVLLGNGDGTFDTQET